MLENTRKLGIAQLQLLPDLLRAHMVQYEMLQLGWRKQGVK